MSFDLIKYQAFCPETFVRNSPEHDLLHIISGVAAECAEALEKLEDNDVEGFRKEVGGILYYSAMLFNEITENYNPASTMLYDAAMTNRNTGIDLDIQMVSTIKWITSATQKYHRGDLNRLALIHRCMMPTWHIINILTDHIGTKEIVAIAKENMGILKSRKERNVIKGDGDER